MSGLKRPNKRFIAKDQNITIKIIMCFLLSGDVSYKKKKKI